MINIKRRNLQPISLLASFGESEVILNNKDCIITSTPTIVEQQGMKNIHKS